MEDTVENENSQPNSQGEELIEKDIKVEGNVSEVATTGNMNDNLEHQRLGNETTSQSMEKSDTFNSENQIQNQKANSNDPVIASEDQPVDEKNETLEETMDTNYEEESFEQTHNQTNLTLTIDAAFSKYDEDNNGSIDRIELESICREMDVILSQEEISEALDQLDQDHSGRIEKQEFIEWWNGRNSNADRNTKLQQVKTIAIKENHVDIHIAAWEGDLNSVQSFLHIDRSLANLPDTTEFGGASRPLHYAAYNGYIEVVKLLLNNGANPNLRNDEGCTPLFLAAQQNQIEVAKILIKIGGARMDIADKKYGFSALDVAGSEEMRALLLQFCDNQVPPKLQQSPNLNRDKIGLLSVTWRFSHRKGDGKDLPVKCFRVRLVDASDHSITIRENLAESDATSLTFGNVSFPTAIVAVVCVTNSIGESEWSDPSNEVIAVEKPSQLGKPEIISASRSSIKILWKKPNTNGSKILNYQIELAKVPANEENAKPEIDWKNVGFFPGSILETSLSGLEPATEYIVRFYASNAVGKSNPSRPSKSMKTKGLPLRMKKATTKMRAAMAFMR